MEGKNTGSVSAFESLFTTGRIQMLKVIASWLPPSRQAGFAVCIRLMELQYSFSLLQNPPRALSSSAGRLSADFFSGDNAEAMELLDELLPYGSSEEQKRIRDIKNMLQNFAKMKEMMSMIEMLKELFPEGFGTDGDNPGDILSGLAGMSGMDMSSIFEMMGKENQ